MAQQVHVLKCLLDFMLRLLSCANPKALTLVSLSEDVLQISIHSTGTFLIYLSCQAAEAELLALAAAHIRP